MSIGCHCEVCSISDGDPGGDCRDEGAGGRTEDGRVEGGAFSMSELDGEGAWGVGDLGCSVRGGGEVSCSGGCGIVVCI